LDSPPEEAFDRLVRLAASSLRAPVALMSLVEHDRQFLKSQHGLREPWSFPSHPALPQFLCREVIRSDQAVIVPDVRSDPRCAARTIRRSPQMVAYAGVPLRSLSGHAIGTFCVMDSRPRRWTPRQVSILEDVAASLMSEVERRLAVDDQAFAIRALRSSEERFRGTFNQAAVGMALVSPDGRWLRVNDQLCQLTGYSREELLSCHFQDITHPDDLQAEMRMVQSLLDGRITTYSLEKRAIRKDGEIVWINLTVSLIRDSDGSPREVIAVVEDATERRCALQALREADNRKDEFLAMLGHELRNPLAPIRNAVEIIDLLGPHTPELTRQRDIVCRQVSHLSRLVDDLLDVGRITQGRVVIRQEPVSIKDVVAQSLTSIDTILRDRRQTIDVRLPPHDVFVQGDVTRLAQVISNLLDNAAKYSPPDRRIDLAVEVREGSVSISVRDEGVGMTQELLPRVFDLFIQGDTSIHRGSGGLGVGLSLVRHFTEMHGGKVHVTSPGTDQGSTFTITLPVFEGVADPVTQAEVAKPRTTPAKRRVLVVDDNEDSRDSLALLLRLAGHDVISADDGMKALEIADAFGPEVVILDIGLPELSGYEVARHLRQSARHSGATLVAITGYGRAEDRTEALRAGFAYHLVKPADPREVLSLLQEIPGDWAESPTHSLHARRGPHTL
jgi:two-component system CheB/CheR fusion protein